MAIVQIDSGGRPAALYHSIWELAVDEEPEVTREDVAAYCEGLAAAWTAAGAEWECGPWHPAAVADWLLCSEAEEGMVAFVRWYRRGAREGPAPPSPAPR